MDSFLVGWLENLRITSAKKATVDTALPDKYTLEMAPMVLRTVASRFHYDELRSGAPSQMLGDELQKLVTSAGVQAPPMLMDEFCICQPASQDMPGLLTCQRKFHEANSELRMVLFSLAQRSLCPTFLRNGTSVYLKKHNVSCKS